MYPEACYGATSSWGEGYRSEDIYGRLFGGGGGDKGCFDAKSAFFGRFWIFSPWWLWILLKSWYLPILDMENSKIKVPWPNEMVAVRCKAGKLAGFQGKTLVPLNTKPQPTTGRAYISNILFP